jgi:hypothetical protein
MYSFVSLCKTYVRRYLYIQVQYKYTVKYPYNVHSMNKVDSASSPVPVPGSLVTALHNFKWFI